MGIMSQKRPRSARESAKADSLFVADNEMEQERMDRMMDSRETAGTDQDIKVWNMQAEAEEKEEDMEELKERYILSLERIKDIITEENVREPYRDYFRRTASFIIMVNETVSQGNGNHAETPDMETLRMQNDRLYEDIIGDNYESSYANPAYAVKMLGKEYGKLLSFLYAEIRGMIVYACEGRLHDIVIHNELFIEIYNLFEYEEENTAEEIQKAIYWFVSDYSDVTVEYRVREQLDPTLSFATDIIMHADLNDLRYLYRFGEYISENELKTAEHLNSLPQEKIDAMAFTFTEGYRIGFVKGNKDLSKKEIVNIRYSLGFERIVRAAVIQFAKLGLKPTIYRAAVNTINKKQHYKIGYCGTSANKQYDYDHKADNAIYLDKAFAERKLGVLRVAYEKYRDLAGKFAGPAVMEIFGETPFVPKNKEEAYTLSEKQQRISVNYDSEAGQIVNEYIKGEERSFTIIAYPVPEIGENFKEIFDEVVKINTLDYNLYENIQQTIIDALDQGDYVHIRGKGSNQTDLKVRLYKLDDPEKQTKFENCVADVNIPVGEVFTSPKLEGTEGRLHVSQVYLNELKYTDLFVDFKDGMVSDYGCSNFDTEEENRKYIRENVLYHHETLPLGEFAIGTNTTAYVMAEKYQIADKMPILIAEKMGPHFAVGDTCYSWAEENKVCNPDGKEIVAKDNEVSILRKEDVSRAYVNCHTDITIPYNELGEISVVKSDGTRITIILDGRFVLEGTEELNKPLKNMVD